MSAVDEVSVVGRGGGGVSPGVDASRMTGRMRQVVLVAQFMRAVDFSILNVVHPDKPRADRTGA